MNLSRKNNIQGTLILIKEDVSEFLIGYSKPIDENQVGIIVGYAKEDSEMLECILGGERVLLFCNEFDIISS
jgi:hypothetical protein